MSVDKEISKCPKRAFRWPLLASDQIKMDHHSCSSISTNHPGKNQFGLLKIWDSIDLDVKRYCFFMVDDEVKCMDKDVVEDDQKYSDDYKAVNEDAEGPKKCKSWVAFLQGFLPINPSGRVNWGTFSFWE